MKILDAVREVRRHLEENGRLSLRMLRLQVDLDDDRCSPEPRQARVCLP